jgi:hypothetical protein
MSKVIRVKRKGLYKFRQEMSKKEGRYLTINEALDILQAILTPPIIYK